MPSGQCMVCDRFIALGYNLCWEHSAKDACDRMRLGYDPLQDLGRLMRNRLEWGCWPDDVAWLWTQVAQAALCANWEREVLREPEAMSWRDVYHLVLDCPDRADE